MSEKTTFSKQELTDCLIGVRTILEQGLNYLHGVPYPFDVQLAESIGIVRLQALEGKLAELVKNEEKEVKKDD